MLQMKIRLGTAGFSAHRERRYFTRLILSRISFSLDAIAFVYFTVMAIKPKFEVRDIKSRAITQVIRIAAGKDEYVKKNKIFSCLPNLHSLLFLPMKFLSGRKLK